MFPFNRTPPIAKKEAELIRHERGQNYLPPTPSRRKEWIIALVFLASIGLFLALLLS